VKGSPRPPMNMMIETANALDSPILALDLPSGLDPDSGQAHPPTIQAEATVTLALPKTGLLAEGAAAFVGQLWLADISIPNALYQEMSLAVSPTLFAATDIIEIAAV
ncbi:MAG: NAD(P)H-hydrate epimerase, partial [Anaerolineales bacterium]